MEEILVQIRDSLWDIEEILGKILVALGKPYGKERDNNTAAPPGGAAKKEVELKASSMSVKERTLSMLKVGELHDVVYKRLLKAVQRYHKDRKHGWPLSPTTNKRLSLYEVLCLVGFDDSWYEEVLK